MNEKIIDIGKDFSRYPAGRFEKDGMFSGELFRETLLAPALKENQHIIVKFDDTAGYGSSFLEESFGGLIRCCGFSLKQIKETMTFDSEDQSLIDEIEEYLDDAEKEKCAKN